MSLLTNQTSLNGSEFFFLRGSGQRIDVSTLNANTISTNTITANSSIANQLSTILLDANDINASTIFAYEVFIDNQGLTATPTELLLNGIPLATTSNLSTIADWALDPAISSVNMNGFDLLSTNNIKATNVTAQNGMFQNLMVQNVFAVSTYTSTISSLAEVAQFGFIDNLSTGVATGGEFAPSSLWGQPSSYYQDLVSTFSSFNSDNIQCSTLTASAWISTPNLYVSSINGAEFTSTTLTIEVAGVSSLVANSISSAGAILQEALVSTLQFNPSFNPNLDVNLGLGSLFGNLAGAASGVLGVVVGGAALGTGIAALAQGRQTKYINSNAYELVNGTTQLQISTLGSAFSTIYRFVSSSAENVPGEEIFISTVSPAGVAIRSMSDPLNTTSSPNSTIQAFGQWVPLPEVPAASTISSFSDIYTSSLVMSTLMTNYEAGLRGGVPFLNATPGISTTEAFTSAAPEYSGDFRANKYVFSFAGLTGNDFTQDAYVRNYAGSANPPRLEVGNGTTGGALIAYLSDIPGVTSSYTNLYTQNLDVSTINFPTGVGGLSGDDAFTTIQGINSLFSKNAEFSTIQGEGGGNLTIITPVSAVSLSTPEVAVSSVIGSDIKISGTSVDLLASAGGSSHINANFISLLGGGSGENSIQLQGNLSTISVYAEQSIIVGSGTSGPNPTAYISVTAPAIEVTGLSSINGFQYPGYFYSAYSSTSQTVVAANTSTLVTYDEATTNIGGFTFGVDAIGVPVPGTYELSASFQFATSSGGTKLAEFWLVKNGAAVPWTNSRVSVVNNGDTLGNISVIDTAAAAGDKYGWMFYSSDTNMTATAVAPGAVPGIPSIIVSAKRLA